MQERQILMIIKNCYSLPKQNNKIRTIRSPLFYVGDKFKLVDEIKQYFPEYIDNFIEPFTGGGSMFLNIYANKYALNDIDSNIFNLHKFLQKQADNSNPFFENIEKYIDKYKLSKSYLKNIVPIELKRKWKKTYYAKYNKIGYEKLRVDYNNGKKHCLLLYLLLIYGFNRMLRFNANKKFNIPVGNVDFNKNVFNALNDYFRFVKDKNIQFFNLDFYIFIKSLKINNDDLIYLDPPYLISFSEYNKIWNEEKERLLLNLLDELDHKNVKFAISNIIEYKGRKNKIFINWMKQYNEHRINSNYISYHDNSIKKIDEVLITNY